MGPIGGLALSILALAWHGGGATHTPSITVKMVPSKKTLFLKSVGFKDTVANVKSEIAERELIEPEKQRLIFAGKELDNDHVLGEIGVRPDSTLFLVQRKEPGSGFIANRAGRPHFGSQVSPHDPRAQDGRGARKSDSQPRQRVQISVKTVTGLSLPLDVDLADTVGEVKRRVQASQGLRAGEQRLTFAGRLLDDSRALSEYKVQQGNTLHLDMAMQTGGKTTEKRPTVYIADTPYGKVRLDGPRMDMQIFLEAKGGRKWSLSMSSHSVLLDLVAAVEANADVPMAQQHLSLLGETLYSAEAPPRDEAPSVDVPPRALFVPLTQLGVREGDTIDLGTDGGHVSFRTRAKQFELYVGQRELVAHVMARIQGRWSMPMARQCLRFQGRPLNTSMPALDRPFFEALDEARRTPGIDRGVDAVDLLTCGRRVSVKPAWGAPFPLDVAPSDRVVDVMTRIQLLHGIPAHEQRLSIRGELLNKEAALLKPFLHTFGVSDRDTVELARSTGGFVVVVEK
uniref:Ubiquitin-like domain-containing protein n=1 Tax=Zooxanthella nutricula TaxID=1333877 RepID=A0A7S2PY26_9DINO|mmetsp:Transcript_72736/g.222739  ORF Transcript_72736/g.222739 Transcript_72736/m.222739 type:complete len:512 (+) Transcript_72736:74-1609(+)